MKWLKPSEAAEVLDIPASTVVELCRTGKLRGAVKWGRLWRIPPAAVHGDSLRPDPRFAKHMADVALASERGRGWRQSSVYLIGPKDGPIKIGTALNLEKRLRQLRAMNPEPLELLAHREGGLSSEAAIHREFAAFRLRGEWFRREPELLEFIELLKADAR